MKKTGTFFLTRDNLRLGLVLGLIAPLLVFVLVYFLKFTGYTFSEYTEHFLTNKQVLTFWGVWCLVGNIALFTFFINTNKDKTARGIFAVTVLYGIGILLAKLFM